MTNLQLQHLGNVLNAFLYIYISVLLSAKRKPFQKLNKESKDTIHRIITVFIMVMYDSPNRPNFYLRVAA